MKARFDTFEHIGTPQGLKCFTGVNVSKHSHSVTLNMWKRIDAALFEQSSNFDFSISSGNGLVPSGNKPLPELMLKFAHYTLCHIFLSDLAVRLLHQYGLYDNDIT